VEGGGRELEVLLGRLKPRKYKERAKKIGE
jgi:hypothetical protein